MSNEETEKSDNLDEKYALDEEDDKDDETRAAEEKAAREAARKRCYKYSDPPKLYTDVKVSIIWNVIGKVYHIYSNWH